MADDQIRITRRPLSVQFPSDKTWPVVPPDAQWLLRWHWLRCEDGRAYLAHWYHKSGWHWGWSGKPEPEDLEGWVYLQPATPPLGERL